MVYTSLHPAPESLIFPFHCWPVIPSLSPVSLLGSKPLETGRNKGGLCSKPLETGRNKEVLCSKPLETERINRFYAQNPRNRENMAHSSLPERRKVENVPILASLREKKGEEKAYFSLPEREERRGKGLF